uniref:Carcinoembryonic antigen-related cell adhesion molecule 6-like n=1 Tax=Ursus maritimus TaxID=29073 RepID=A0A452TAG4_URSMA
MFSVSNFPSYLAHAASPNPHCQRPGHIHPSGVRVHDSQLDPQPGHGFLSQGNVGRPSLSHDREGTGCSSLRGSPTCEGTQVTVSDPGSVNTGGFWLGLSQTSLGLSSEGQCGTNTDQELPLPSDYITCGFILFAPDGLDAPTISPSDSYYHPGASLMLSCHAASNPPARYSWLVNGRPQTSTQELFIPNVTVNDSGAYTCVASNSGTRLSKTTVKTITVSDGRSTTGLPVGSIIGIAVGVLVALALTVALGCLLLRTRTGRDSGWHDLRELWCPASTPRHGPARSSTYPDSLPSPTTAVPIYQELRHPNTNIYGQMNHKAEMAS